MNQLKWGVLVLCVITMASCKTKKKVSSDVDAFLAAEETAESTNTNAEAKEDNSKSEVEWPSEEKSEKKIVVKEEEATILSGEDAGMNSFKYFVIIGSFANENNARNYKSTMVDKGFKPTILENNSGYYRVAVFNSNSEQEARTKIQEIRTKFPQHQDVWLLNRKGI